MDKKVVFFDIDGTIYEYGKGIMPSAIEAVKLLKENGHIPVICTGRTKAMIFPEIVEMGFTSIISGGGTYAEYENTPIYLEEMNEQLAKSVIESMKKHGFMPIPEGHEYMYLDMDNIADEYADIYKIYQQKISDKIKQIDYEDMRVSKISAAFTKKSDWDAVYNEFCDTFTFVNHNGKLMELIPKEYSKAVGIERFIKYIGVARKDTYAFGDSFNDLEMLKYVEYGVAMGNSHEGLFEHVKYKTDDIDNDGVYKALKKFELI